MSKQPEKNPINILYIASNGRSGSTLLDRVLGQIQGVTSLGETRFIWEHGFVDNNLCECQEAFGTCERWQNVAKAAFGELSEERAKSLAVESRKLLWTGSIARMNGWFASRQFRRMHQDHLETTSKLYDAIAEEFDSNWLVDSSKMTTYALLLSGMSNIRLHTVHLVRDSRAVAYSWQRKRVKPEVVKRRAFMPVRPPLLTAFRWNLHNFLFQRLSRVSESYVRVRYEDFVSTPEDTVARIASEVGLGRPDLDFISGDTVHLERGHTVAGNPGRFKCGPLKLVLDDEWRRSMPTTTHAPITLMTSPQLLAYGYPLQRSVSKAHQEELVVRPGGEG